jgi:hypothetical protein
MGIIACPGDEGSNIINMAVPLINARWPYFLSASQNRIAFNLMLHTRDAQNVERLGPRFLLDFNLYPLSNARLSDGLSNSTDVSKCRNVVQKWVQLCSELHPKCLLGRKTDWFPTRLLDLQNVEACGYINLVLPDSSWADKPYATLSHCWGGSIPLKLTTATFASFRAGLAVEQLPKTFIEAIKVAMFLGIYYIWIDALTIIQDSSDDWEKEASLMGDVYQHAFINIGATASTNSHGGLFFERDPVLVNPPIHTLDRTDYVIIDNTQWSASVEDSPLFHRGWVVQERLLCSKIIHFCKDQLFWECRTAAYCETRPDESESTAPLFKTDDELAATVIGGETTSIQQERSGRLYRQWYKVVENYSSSKLTFANDKLIAISGMAKMFQQQLGDDYVAGMWKTNLIHQLTWTCVVLRLELTEDTSGTNNHHYVAPSWSWASTNRKILFPRNRREVMNHETTQFFAEILEIGLNYKGSDTFSQLTGGFLRIRAPLNEIVVSMRYPSCNLTIVKTGSTIMRDRCHVSIDDIHFNRSNHTETLLCCLLYAEKRQVLPHKVDPSRIRALLLRRASGTEIRFERVGLLRTSNQDAIRYLSGIERIPFLPDELFHPEHGYTIEII